jgi:hypothetical protein
MKRLLVLTAVCVAAMIVMLALPNHGNAQPPPDSGGPGFGNYLFDRWVDNRRAANGGPTPNYYNYRSWYSIYGDQPSFTTKAVMNWIDNRRAFNAYYNGGGYYSRYRR